MPLLLRTSRRHGTINQVTALQRSNLLAYWPIYEAGGTVVADVSGNSRNGTYNGVTLGQPGVNGTTSGLWNGTSSLADVYSASLAAAFNGGECTISLWLKVSAVGVWSDATSRRLLTFQVDANNRFLLQKTATANVLNWFYVAGATTKQISKTTTAPTGWVHIALTVSKSGDALKAYYNGAQEGATQTGLGTFAGSLPAGATVLGALSTTPGTSWSGYLAHVAVWNTPLSAAQIAELAVAT